MTQERTLSSYGSGHFPINDIIQKRLKLTALILARPDLYFLPETILAGSEIRTSVANENLALNMRQPSISGKYELTDILSIVTGLEDLAEHDWIDSRSRSIEVAGLKWPDGVTGCLIVEEWDCRPRPKLASILLDRILLEEVCLMDQLDEGQISTAEEPGRKSQTRTRSDGITTSMNLYVSECTANGKTPDLDECWRFTLGRSGIEENHNGNLLYPIRGGQEVREINRKRFSERFKALLVDR